MASRAPLTWIKASNGNPSAMWDPSERDEASLTVVSTLKVVVLSIPVPNSLTGAVLGRTMHKEGRPRRRQHQKCVASAFVFVLLMITTEARTGNWGLLHRGLDSTLDGWNSRLRNVTLGMGCPEFLSTYFEANASTTQPYRSFTIIKGPGYGYIAVHFSKLWMPPGSSIVLRGAEGFDRQDVLVNLTASFPSGQLFSDVYAAPVLAKELRIEFYRDVGPGAAGQPATGTASVNDNHCYGFVVDSYHYMLMDDSRNVLPSREATCASDDTKEAVCYYEEADTRQAYIASRAVARLLIQKGKGIQAACTGWLLGSQGHMMTNYHCIKDQAQASATAVEFMADSPSCAQSCMTWGGCPGTVEAISTTLIHANELLDYALVKLQTNVDLPKKYGYLRLKATQGKVGQEVYIPQHPLHYGKRIAMVDDFGNHITIMDLAATGCNVTGYSYNGDTQGGSSGSPVLDSQDHGVVALHHCGQYCSNTGIPSVQILSDLKANNLLPDGAIDSGDNRNTEVFPKFERSEAAPPRLLNSQLIFNGAIQILPKGRAKSVDQFAFTLVDDAEVAFDVLSAEVSDDGTFTDINGDCQANYMDAIIFLFARGSPAVVLVNDDAASGTGTADGSISSRDPYARTFLKAGSYILAIGAMPSNAMDAYSGQCRVQDPPEIFSCIKRATYGSYRIEFQSSATMSFSTLPPAATLDPAGCHVPPAAICPL